MLDSQDQRRLDRALTEAAWIDGENSFARVAGDAVAGLGDVMTFDHVATLVFPDSVEDVRTFLTAAGLDAGPAVPSVVVRDRLARRYGLSAQDLEVMIVRGYPRAGRQGGVEVFSLSRASADRLRPGLVTRERATEAEAHLAWQVAPENVDEVRRFCGERLGLTPDGGGYNPDEDARAGGRTVLYFRAVPGSTDLPGRWELTCSGHQPGVLAAHLDTGTKVPDKHTALLSILAGHWAARAVHVAAEIGLADVLREQPRRASAVATRTGCDPAAIDRLLRYLTDLGLVRQLDDTTYVNTELGRLLCSDNPFNDLTRLYGGVFYDAWSEFASTVRTGRTAFSHRFGGQEHFDYFASHPAVARTFDRSMQAVTRLAADELSQSYPFSAGATVIDVGGGDGTLLRAILRDHATVTGILFDRAHVSANAAAGHHATADGDRFRSESGDFFTEVPAGGDVYLLSRVLHDWDDEDCHRILSSCRRACRRGSTMLVLERLLADDKADSARGGLAAVWDMQMLAITGGRERGQAEYEKILLGAGFRVEEVKPLVVGLNLLVASAV